MKQSILEQIQQVGVIPVLVIDAAQQAVPTAEALQNGGLPIMEITLRTPQAIKSIEQIAEHTPQVVVGAGTVLSIDHAISAVSAGAQFLVSPGMDEELIIWALERDILIFCGAVTPTEIMQGLRFGLSCFKFFPFAAMGGIATLQAIADPFPKINFIPTGGINQNNLAETLTFERIFAVGGSWMVKREMIAENRFDEITTLSQAAVDVVKRERG
jgi:2-dehydro-3-deoxyphosphogluconate aldolase/(4S)-4-hydroxy-2-oxoglutarate aldolase